MTALDTATGARRWTATVPCAGELAGVGSTAGSVTAFRPAA